MISPRTRRTRLALAGGRDDGGTAARAFADSGDAPGTLPCCPCGHGTFGVLLPSYGCDATALLRSDALDRCPSAAVDLFPEVRSLRTGRSTLRCRPRECVARVGEDFLGALRGGGGETYSAPFAFLSLSYIHLEFGRAQSFFSDRGTSEKTLAPPIRGRIRTRPRGIATTLFFFFFPGEGGGRERRPEPGKASGWERHRQTLLLVVPHVGIFDARVRSLFRLPRPKGSTSKKFLRQTASGNRPRARLLRLPPAARSTFDTF